jgi:hypothetical protein
MFYKVRLRTQQQSISSSSILCVRVCIWYDSYVLPVEVRNTHINGLRWGAQSGFRALYTHFVTNRLTQGLCVHANMFFWLFATCPYTVL